MDGVKMYGVTSTYHHGDLANALLEAVGEIVAERGATGVSLREAARRAGVSHSAPAHHFGDKTGLLQAYALQGWEMLGAALRDAFTETEGSGNRAMLTTMGRTYFRFAIDHPTHYEVMLRMMDDCDDPLAAVNVAGDAAFTPLALMVGRLVEDGVVRPDRARYVASMLWGVVHGVAHLWQADRLTHFYEDHTSDEFIDGLLDTMVSFILDD